MLNHFSEGFKLIMDALSYTVVLGVLTQLIPVVAGIMSIVWLGMQIQDRLENRKKK